MFGEEGFVGSINGCEVVQIFHKHNATFPARSCVEVARLPKDVKIEIEAIAVRR